MTRAEEERAVAKWLAERPTEPLPPHAASAPKIAFIRKAIANGEAISFNRDRGKRTITFNPGTAGAGTPVHDEGGGRMRRRQKRRLPNRNGTLL